MAAWALEVLPNELAPAPRLLGPVKLPGVKAASGSESSVAVMGREIEAASTREKRPCCMASTTGAKVVQQELGDKEKENTPTLLCLGCRTWKRYGRRMESSGVGIDRRGSRIEIHVW